MSALFLLVVVVLRLLLLLLVVEGLLSVRLYLYLRSDKSAINQSTISESLSEESVSCACAGELEEGDDDGGIWNMSDS